MQKKVVIFDMDGVLLNTEYLNDVMWEALFKELSIECDEVTRRRIIGMGLEEERKFFAEHITQKYTFDELREMKEILFFEAGYDRQVEVKPGVLDLIALLKENDIKIAVASSTTRFRGENLLNIAGIKELFDYSVFGDEVSNKKPDPEIYLNAISYFGVHKDEALIIEDSYSGVLGANRGSIDVIWSKDLMDIHQFGEVNYIQAFDSLEYAQDLLKTLI